MAAATATIEQPTQQQLQPAPVSDRTAEMLSAAKQLIDEHQIWASDPHTPAQPTIAFERALKHAVNVIRNGDVPARCQELWVATGRLLEAWNAYARGLRQPDQSPTPQFWATFEGFKAKLQASKPRKAKRMEPVRALLDQRVSPEQIGRWIYGDGKAGPFIDEHGHVDVDAIYQEAAQPGSIVPADWVHPSMLRAQSDETAGFSAEEIAMIERDGHEKRPQIIDKATVEQLLREGQFPDVIAKVKGITIDEVHSEARRLNIKTNTRPNWGGADVAEDVPSTELPPQDSTLEAIAAAGDTLSDVAGTVDGDIVEDLDRANTATATARNVETIDEGSIAAIDVRIIQLWNNGNSNMGAPEIARVIGGVTVQKVAAVIRQAKKRAQIDGDGDGAGNSDEV